MGKPNNEERTLSDIKKLSLKVVKPDRWVIALTGTVILAPLLPSIITTTVIGAVLTNFLVRPFLEFDWKNKDSEKKQGQLSDKLIVNLAKTFLGFTPLFMICTYVVSHTLREINKEKNSLVEKLKNIPKKMKEAMIGKESSLLEELGNDIQKTAKNISKKMKEAIIGKESNPLEELGNEVEKTVKKLADPILQVFSDIKSNISHRGTTNNSSSDKKR